jgi:hypothetical protein
MLRITLIDSSDSVVRLRIEGRLSGSYVEELRLSCELQASGGGARLTLDLADVSFADARGIALLLDLERNHVALLNPLPFLALQLRGPKDGNRPDAAKVPQGSRSKE